MFTLKHIFIFFLFYHLFLATIAYLRIWFRQQSDNNKEPEYDKKIIFTVIRTLHVHRNITGAREGRSLNPSEAHKHKDGQQQQQVHPQQRHKDRVQD